MGMGLRFELDRQWDNYRICAPVMGFIEKVLVLEIGITPSPHTIYDIQTPMK